MNYMLLISNLHHFHWEASELQKPFNTISSDPSLTLLTSEMNLQKDDTMTFDLLRVGM